jgi:hypothetical protein
MRVLSLQFAIGLAKGLAAIALAGLGLLFLRYFLAERQVQVPSPLWQLIVFLVLWGALWLGSGKFIRQLISEHKNDTR